MPKGSDTLEAVAVRVLTTVLSVRDSGTNAHAQRMVQFVEETARRLGCSAEEQHLIRLAALLHDVGKIGIPDIILNKPGPLTDEEWAIMRCHPQIGRQILEQIGGVFRPLAAIVVAHHEHWDGHGYPFGLQKDAIPLGARILAVVDSFDAMTSHRPYRNPLSIVQARAELQRCAGSHYDPCVLEAFLRVLDEQDPAPLADVSKFWMRSNKDRSVNAQKNQLDRPIATQSPLIKISLTEHEGEFLIALE